MMQCDSKSSFLCETCHSIFTDGSLELWKDYKENNNGRYKYHSCSESFSTAVSQGCWLCVQLKRSLYAYDPENLEAGSFDTLYSILKWNQVKSSYHL